MVKWKLAVVAALGGAVLAFAGNKDEDAVKKRIGEFQEAFNKHDAKAIAAFWTKDGDLVNPIGVSASGPADIQKLVQSDLDNIIHGATSAFTVQKVRFVKPDICIVNMTHEFSGGKLPDGTLLPSGKALVTGVASKQGEVWMWEAGRPMIPFTPPTGPAVANAHPSAAPVKK